MFKQLKELFSASQKPAKRHPKVLQYEELEPRVLFSADFAPGLGDIAVEEQVVFQDIAGNFQVEREAAPETAAQTAAEARWELAFVSEDVADYDQLIADLQGGDNSRIIGMVVLEADRDGIEQVSEILSNRSGLAAVHVITHGANGQINLGDSRLTSTTLEENSDAVAGWGKALTETGDILFYGCNIAADGDGQSLLKNIAELTGVEVAASDDLTGNAALGGDWDLEYRTGSVEASVALDAAAQAEYQGVLDAYVVSNTDATGFGSLHQAITDANANTGVTDTITFNIGGGGPQTIAVDAGGLPIITDSVILDATTQPGYSGTPLITLDGSATPASSGINGITLRANDSTVKGFIVINFADEGIEMDGSTGFGDNNIIQNNWVGIDAAGNVAGNAEHGIMISADASGNQIGGTGPNEGNVTAGNGFSGIIINENSDNNIVEGNIIGIKPDGTTPAGNGTHGILIQLSSDGNRIGGTTAGAGNVIAGNTQDGIYIDGTTDATYTTVSSGTVIQGNWVGTTGTGSAGVGNGNTGINVEGTNTIIGGIGANDGNVITNNGNEGINVAGSGATGTIIQGNIIGLDPDGSTGSGNGDVGIALLSGADDTTIGGTSVSARNVISNNKEGIEINSDFNVVQGNYIGTDITGTLDRGNHSDDGVEINSDDNLIGGTVEGAGNLIAYNAREGVYVVTGSFNEVVGNTITQNVRSGIVSDTDETSIVGNVIYSNSTGFTLDEVIVNGSDVVLYHNTIHGAQDDGISVVGANAIIRNNIITGSAGYGIRINGGSISQESHNLITDAVTGPANLGGRANFALDASDLNADPLYVNAAIGDFRLTSPTSPAIDAGVDLVASQPDVNGAGAGLYDGLAPDMGTFESWVPINNDAPTFAIPGDGSVITDVTSSNDYGYSVTVQPDGKSLVGGYSWTGSSYDFAVTRYNADGTLDTSFGGGDGITTIAVGTGSDLGFYLTLQPDGKILLAGAADNGVDKDFALTRLNSDGTLDTTFGGDGIVTTDIAVDDDYGKAMALQTDGKIVVGGFARIGGDNNFALIRYNSDGSQDTSFGEGDGIVTTAVPVYQSHIADIALQADGKIVAIGDAQDGSGSDFAVVRYNTDGSLDTTFGGDGIVITPIGTGSSEQQSIAVQADGKILAGGYAYNGTNYDFAVARYNTDGNLDTSFGGGDGIATIAIGSGDDRAYNMAVLPDGKIILSGSSDNGTDTDFSAARLNSDGSLDTSFGGGDGFIIAPVGGANDTGYGMAIAPDGSILVAGSIYNGSNVDFALQRLTGDGALDTSFDPVNTLDGNPTFTEGSPAVVLDADVQIFDAELSKADNFSGATLTLVRNSGANAEDSFSATGNLAALTQSGNLVLSGVTIGTVTTNSAGTLVLSFNADATQARVNETLQAIAYANSSDAPPGSVQIDWTFDDGNSGAQGSGGALQATGNTTVSITAVNDDPTNAGSLPTNIPAIKETASNVDLSSIDLIDVDAAGSNLNVTLSTSASGTLSATPGGGVTVAGSGSTSMTLIGTLADLNTYLNNASNIQYTGPTDLSGNDVDTIQVDVTDNGSSGSGGGGTITLGTVKVDISNVTITATDASADETGSDAGQFTVDLGALNNTGADITVNYTVTGTATAGGTDYNSLSGTVTVANGQQTATIDVSGIVDDLLVEGNETVIVTLDSTDNALFTIDAGNNSDTMTIADNDNALNSVSITATDPNASETATDNGQFTVDLGAVNNTGGDVAITYTVTGSATASGDYTALTGSVVIANGQQTATIDVSGIVDDTLIEGSETVIVTLTGTDNALFTIDAGNNSDTVTIADNDNALNSVSITATDPNASETATDNGQFTVDLGALNNTGGDVTITYTVAGTATATGDYTALSGTVVIADGTQTATIDVSGIVDDALIEGNETVIVTLTGTDNALFTIDAGNNSDTVTIADNDNALNSVSISATDPNASETATDNGQFTVDLGAVNNTGCDVTVSYTVTGTATATGDYAALSGSVTIANGQQTATIDISGIVDDVLIEGDETVIVTLTGTENALFTIDTGNNSDTVTIADNDSALNSVSISATDASADETGSDAGQFTVDLGTLNNTGADITVNYTVTGSATATGDYTALSGSVTIANGQQTATIDVSGIVDDLLVESNETVIVTLDSTDNALFTIDADNNSDTVTIADNDNALNSVSITATDPNATETATDNGQFTVDLGAVNNTGSAVTVSYTVTGTATATGDYTALTGSVVIANGQQTATIDISGIVDDVLIEGDETVIVTLTGTDNALFTIDAGNNSDTVTIADNDSALNSVSITATDPNATETATDNGQFTVDLGAVNNTGSAVTVSYTVTGTATATGDYAALSGSGTIANGQQTATIDISGIVDDVLIEGDETVIVTLTGTDNALFTIDTGNNSDTVTIADNDSALNSVSISATDASADETGSDAGQFTVGLGTLNNTGADITVNYTVTGSATATGDYTALSGSVTIANGQQTATIDVSGIVDDTLIEGNETVIVTLTGTDNGLFTIDAGNNSDTVTIADNDSALNSVSISATDASADETGSDAGQFTVDLGALNNTGADITVNYMVTGTATAGGTDYNSLSGTVTVANGQETATIDVSGIVDDLLVEGNETVIVTLDSTDNALFTIDAGNNSDTVTIADNDNALNSVSITATDPNASETTTDNGQFTVDLGAVNNTGGDVTITYTVAGTATATGDYTALSGTVVIADGTQTATIDVSGIVDDALIEGDETVIVTLTGTDNALFTIDTGNNSDTVTIADNDSVLNSVSISATDPNATETATDNGQFTVDLGAVNNTGSAVTVSYTVTGSAIATGDYAALSGSVTIANGQQTATIDVSGIVDDVLIEGSETVIVTLTGTDNALFTIDTGNNSDTVTIADNDSALNSVSISATDPNATETATDNGQFTVDLGAVNNTGGDVTVSYTVTGTATATGDYTALSGTVVIADGTQTATIDVSGIVDDALIEGSETVIVTLTGTDNALFTIDAGNDSDTVTIADNDSALNSVSITATDPNASETATDNGQFTVDLGAVNNTGGDVTVNYTVTGSATATGDYTALSGSVVIADGTQTATIDVTGIIDDALVEGSETVIVTLTGTDNALFTIDAGNNSDTVTIADNDSALNSVSITATDPNASETATDNGQFTVDLGAVNNTGGDVTVSYTVAGTATATGDYTALSGTVVIADGQQIATIDLTGIIDDALVEGNETVIVTLTGTDNALFTIDAGNNSDTVTIADNDNALNSVSISATDASADETGSDAGQFTVDLGAVNNTGGDVTVTYTVAGTATATGDYTALSGTVVIADGQQIATIDVSGIVDDALIEGSETVIVTLTGTDNALFTIDAGNNSDTVTIADNDNALNSVSISATDVTASETATDNGQFTVDLGAVNNTGGDVTVNYTVTGSATATGDYTALSGSVVIADGTQTATIDVTGIIDDALVEGSETVIVTLTGTDNALFTIDAGNNSDTVTIADNDCAFNSVSITATDPNASETATDNGQFTVDLGAVNNTGGDVTVSYTVTGSATATGDYIALSGTVVIADGTQTATIDVSGIVDDALIEGAETVIVNLTGTDNALFTIDAGNNSDTVTIADNDSALNSVSITATDPNATETATDNGRFTVDLGAVNNTGGDVTVNYTVTGTATATGDYTALSGSVTIADAQQTATIDVTGIADDLLVEGNETVIVTLTGTDNALFTIDAGNNSDTVTIADNDSALNSVSITATDPNATETATDNGQFTVDLGAVNNTGGDVTVSYTVAGTATATGDYTALSGSVVIADGTQTATIDVTGIIDDALVEGNETVIVTLTGTDNALFTIDAGNNSDTVNITDNDTTVLTVANVTVNEAAGTLTFDVVADKAVAGGFTVDYNFTDIEAVLGTDFSDAGTGTLTFSGNAGETQQVTVNIANDTLFESDETFGLNLTNASNARVDDTDTAIGTITDNDGANAVLSVTQHGSESGPTTIIYTVTLNHTNNTGSAITFDLTDAGTGTATSGTDYTAFGGAGVITVANGASTGQLVVVVADDALSEGSESVDATLTNASDADVTITGANATATITDNDSNGAPVAADDAASSNEDTVIVGNVLSNDSDADGDTLTASLVIGPSNGNLTLNADGGFSYTPDADWSGIDSFTYTANDGTLDSNDATVTITVNSVDDTDPDDGGTATDPDPILLEDPVTDEDEESDVESPTYEVPGEDPLTEDEVVSPVEAIQTPQDLGEADESIVQIKDSQDEEAQDIIYLTDEIDRNTQSEERDDDRGYTYYDNDLYKDMNSLKYWNLIDYNAQNEPVAVSLDDVGFLDFDSDDTDPVGVNGDYDALRQEIDESFNTELEGQAIKAKIVTVTAATFTVGIVSWLLRAGSLVASMMSALPLWRGFDPIAIFSGDKKKKKKQDEISDTGELKPEAIFDGDAE